MADCEPSTDAQAEILDGHKGNPEQPDFESKGVAGQSADVQAELPRSKSEKSAPVSEDQQPASEKEQSADHSQQLDATTRPKADSEVTSLVADAISGEGQTVARVQQRSKVRTTVPNEGVELAIGKGALEGAEPVTFGQLFQQRVQEFPDVAALKWKEKEEGVENKMVWKSTTYKEYYRSCIDAAKSFLKVYMDFTSIQGVKSLCK